MSGGARATSHPNACPFVAKPGELERPLNVNAPKPAKT